MRLSKTTTHSAAIKGFLEFPNKFYEINGNKYSLALSLYVSSRIKIIVICKKCKSLKRKYVFATTPKHLVGNSPTGCPKCSAEITNNHNRTPYEDVLENLKFINDKVEIIKDIIQLPLNRHSYQWFRCLTCGESTYVRVGDKLDGAGCKYCKPTTNRHLDFSKAKLYTFKLSTEKGEAYKIGVTVAQDICNGSGNLGRYNHPEDMLNISEISYLEFKHRTEALKSELDYLYFSKDVNSKYLGAKLFKSNTQNSELFNKPINLLKLNISKELLTRSSRKGLQYE